MSALAAVGLLMARSASRLKEHYHERHFSPVADPTGTVQKALALTPLPNDFRSGDGLNTAGYTWQRPTPFPRTQYDFKIDHYFTPTERFAVTYTHENNDNPNANQPQPFPTVPGGTITSWIRVLSVNVLSSLKPNLINEFRGGFHRPKQADRKSVV